MLTWLLALPTWAKAAIIGVALVGALQVRHWWQVRSLNRQIQTLTRELKDERTVNATLRIALADLSANQEKLVTQIRDQNASIVALQTRTRTIEANASAAALRAIRAGEAAAAALRARDERATRVIPPGFQELNTWLVDRFAQQ